MYLSSFYFCQTLKFERRKIMIDDTIGICTFRKKSEAVEALRKLKAVADLSGLYVSLAMAEWCCGLRSTAWANTIGWTSDTIKKFTTIRKTNMGFYTIYAPMYDWHESNNDDICKNESEETTTAQGEPININIPLDKWFTKSDNVKALIQSLFEDPEKIKDRSVFINIM